MLKWLASIATFSIPAVGFVVGICINVGRYPMWYIETYGPWILVAVIYVVRRVKRDRREKMRATEFLGRDPRFQMPEAGVWGQGRS